jgi:hypothetical protein
LKSWSELSTLERSNSIYWDMYKDAYGTRPRGIDTSNWTVEHFEKEFELLATIISTQEKARLESEQRASHDFEIRIQNLLACGAVNREMALKWIHEAEGSNGDDEYLCYLVGLPYSYFRTTV